MKETLIITEKQLQRYIELNKQKKQIEAEINHLKKIFHQYFDQTNGKMKKGEIQQGMYKVQRQIRKTMTYIDEPTIQKLEQLNLNDFITTVKKPDTDKLEAAINLGLVDEEDFVDCTRTKVTEAIVVRES